MDNQHQKTSGDRDLSHDEIDLMNDLKALEGKCAEALTRLDDMAKLDGDHAAGRWASLARTNLETGFMYALKAVARPTNGLGRK